MGGAIINSTSVHWNTPEWLVQAVLNALGGTISLDPCSNPNSIVGATKSIQLPENGLEANWCDYSSIYVNPPYGRGIDKWIAKAKASARDKCHVVMVIPAAVDTKHWHTYIWPHARAICFLKGRVKFDLPDKKCPDCGGQGEVEVTYGYEDCSMCDGERMVPQGGASSTVATAVVLFSDSDRVGALFYAEFQKHGKVLRLT